jgi:hypothetical protein
VTDIDTVRSFGTLLKFSGIGIPLYSCRGAKQTLVHISQAASIKRTLNGALRDISQPEFRKYGSVINCRDQRPPAISGVWPGRVIVVDCVAELSYLTAGGSPERTVVSSRVEGLYTRYRPRLEMMVMEFQTSFDEWAGEYDWSMTLEEA